MTRQGRSKQEVFEGTKKLALAAFEDHKLILRDDERGRWRIAMTYEDGSVQGQYATEIVSLWNGRLFVGGDIDDCVFGYYGDKRGTEADGHRAKVRWIGRCNDITYYVEQKATIGLTDSGKLTKAWDEEVAEYDLRELLADEEQEWTEKEKEALEEAIDRMGDGEFHVMDILYNGLQDPFDLLGSLGQVTTPRVIYAWAACRRLCELLDEADGNKE
jgi:hypothetical protein